MDPDTRNALETGGVQLAAISGGVHLYLAVDKLTPYLQAGSALSARPRTYLFLLSGLAVFLGITVWAKTDLRRDVVYALGLALIGGNVLAWLLIGGHGSGLITPAWETQGHSHGGPVGTLITHFFGTTDTIIDPLVLSKTAELILVGVLVALLGDEVRGGGDEDANADRADRTDRADANADPPADRADDQSEEGHTRA